jgi:hypothetical protein
VRELIATTRLRLVDIGAKELGVALGLREIWERTSPGPAEYGRLLRLPLWGESPLPSHAPALLRGRPPLSQGGRFRLDRTRPAIC